MEFGVLIERQVAADRRHGFALDFTSDAERLVQIEKDLVGLFGEIGEFANLIKKIRLAADHRNYDGPTLSEATHSLRAELADAVIYITRLSVMLGGDLEADLIAKMDLNDLRYGKLD